ncbi:MAG: AmmeMemoRadiSam system radical SAM enzyme [Bacteroidales bacterium]|nr:AmmeMemoRadiSam system radical SAM enzyme [Bacteroidales bacterium]
MKKREFIRKFTAAASGIILYPGTITPAVAGPGKDRHLRVAQFQEETARGIMCNICPNECILKEGELSDCRNRIVKDNKLYTMAYGNPCAVNIDPIEKKPLYHFYQSSTAFSIATAGCNFACLNCQNWTISQTSPDKTSNIDLMPERVIEYARANSCKSIAYTYSEPVTFYEYVYDTALKAKKAGIRNVMVSNGYIKKEPLIKLCNVIDAANIDLKSFNNKTYLKLTGGKLQPVLDSLITYREQNVWLEITNLIIPGWTDNMNEIREMCRWLVSNGFETTPLHFSRFHPQYKLEQLPPTPVNILNKAYNIAREEGLKYVYIGNVPGTYATDTHCPECNRVVVGRKGYTITEFNINNGKCTFCNSKVDGIWQ